jgi:polar amino acid transport system substrate-binding protein
MFRRRVLASIAAMSLTGCMSHTASVDSSMQGLVRVRDSRSLRAAFIDYPPSMTVNPNTKAKGGIMPQVLAEAAKAMGIQVLYVEETTFASMVDTLDNNRADIVVSGIWPSSTRALRADFSRVVYYSPVYAYVRSEDVRFDNKLAAINTSDVRIATIDGELSSIVAQSDYPGAATVSLPQQSDVAQLLLQLTSRKADITFVEPAIADAFLAKNVGSIRRVAGVEPVRLFPNTFLFRKGDTGLRDAINVAIVELTNSRRLPAIIQPFDHDGNHFIVPKPPVSP